MSVNDPKRESCPDCGSWLPCPLCPLVNYVPTGGSRETIVAAACRVGDDIYALKPPGRHCHVLRMMFAMGVIGDQYRVTGQGFLLGDGSWIDRFPARTLAESTGQLLPDARNTPWLFSEDVW